MSIASITRLMSEAFLPTVFAGEWCGTSPYSACTRFHPDIWFDEKSP